MSIVPRSYADLEQKKINAVNILLGKSQPSGQDISKKLGPKSDLRTVDELLMMSPKERTLDAVPSTRFHSRGSQCEGSATHTPVVSVSTQINAGQVDVKALRMLKEELISLRNGFVKSIGTLIEIIDSADAEGMHSPRHGVDVETTTESTQCDRGTLTSDKPEPSYRCASMDLGKPAPKLSEIYDGVEVGTPSCYACSSPFKSAEDTVSSPFSPRRRPGRLPRRPCIVGSGPVSPRLSAFSTVGELFVSNVDQDTTISDIFVFLKRKATVIKLSQISHPYARSKSFVLTVPSCEVDNVLCPEFWPLGVRCREFIRPTVGRLAHVS